MMELAYDPPHSTEDAPYWHCIAPVPLRHKDEKLNVPVISPALIPFKLEYLHCSHYCMVAEIVGGSAAPDKLFPKHLYY